MSLSSMALRLPENSNPTLLGNGFVTISKLIGGIGRTVALTTPRNSAFSTANLAASEQVMDCNTRFLTEGFSQSISPVQSPLSATLLTQVASKTAEIGAWFSRYLRTLGVLSNTNCIKRPVKSYAVFERALKSPDLSTAAISTFLESEQNVHRDVLLSCMADYNYELSDDLAHCLIGLLQSDNESIVNCACLALLAGGESSESLLRDTAKKFPLARANGFIHAYCEMF